MRCTCSFNWPHYLFTELNTIGWKSMINIIYSMKLPNIYVFYIVACTCTCSMTKTTLWKSTICRIIKYNNNPLLNVNASTVKLSIGYKILILEYKLWSRI